MQADLADDEEAEDDKGGGRRVEACRPVQNTAKQEALDDTERDGDHQAANVVGGHAVCGVSGVGG